MEEIKDLRFKIDEIDVQLLELIMKRLKIARRIGEIKKTDGLAIIDKKREIEILDRLTLKAKEKGVSPDGIKKLWRKIMDLSYGVEE